MKETIMDWDKVNALLGVIHNASAAGPKYVKWAAKASDELEDLWPKPEPKLEVEVEEPSDDEVPLDMNNNPPRRRI